MELKYIHLLIIKEQCEKESDNNKDFKGMGNTSILKLVRFKK